MLERSVWVGISKELSLKKLSVCKNTMLTMKKFSRNKNMRGQIVYVLTWNHETFEMSSMTWMEV